MASWIPAIKFVSNRPRRETGDDAGDAGRGEQADAVLAHRREGHQRDRDGQNDDHDVDGAQQDAHLRVVLARQQIVLGVEPEAAQVQHRRDVAAP